jgi:hypothetical protein
MANERIGPRHAQQEIGSVQKEKQMKPWLRWALIITQVGGGFTGIVITLDYLQNSENMDPPGLVISIGFVTLYAFVTVAGMLFAQNERRTSPLRAALWLQIPWISSPIITWQFTAGLCVAIALIGESPGVEFWLGSIWQFYLFGDFPLEIGLNLFPVLMLYLLGRMRDPQADSQPSMAAQVNSILQLRLLNTPLADRGIRLQPLPKGGVLVGVGANQYVSVDEVPEEEIRLVIRSAIAEWESRGPA